MDELVSLLFFFDFPVVLGELVDSFLAVFVCSTTLKSGVETPY